MFCFFLIFFSFDQLRNGFSLPIITRPIPEIDPIISGTQAFCQPFLREYIVIAELNPEVLVPRSSFPGSPYLITEPGSIFFFI